MLERKSCMVKYSGVLDACVSTDYRHITEISLNFVILHNRCVELSSHMVFWWQLYLWCVWWRQKDAEDKGHGCQGKRWRNAGTTAHAPTTSGSVKVGAAPRAWGCVSAVSTAITTTVCRRGVKDLQRIIMDHTAIQMFNTSYIFAGGCKRHSLWQS